MRTCSKCGEQKPYDPCAPINRKARGFMGTICWECWLITKQAIRATPEGRVANNAATIKANAKACATPEGRARRNAVSLAWQKDNPEKCATKVMKRRAAKLQRVPSWADLKAIAWFYEEAARLTKLTGIKHEVDHIIPLRGRKVCGLHVEANLQILQKSPNASKGNRMPDLGEQNW